MVDNGDLFEKHNLYIPAYLNAIGFSISEGSSFIPWPKEFGIVQSHRMPRGIYDSLGNIILRCDSLTIQTHTKEGVVYTYSKLHCVLFEKGYLWDTCNGWRNHVLGEKILDEIKSRWLFEQ